ncbi:T9SS type A sorting domain-containing protein, partial [Enterobacter roggenkampii]|nr:T9SS type A sorting domain-containing protein [Enterobacter roggenkampii]
MTALIAAIRIYSFPTGSLVYKENKAINFDIQNTTLNAGIYILEKTDKEGNVTREKVMKINS